MWWISSNKFVKGIRKANPDAEIYRKSGTWKAFHADSGVVVDKERGYQYIIVALMEHSKGADGLVRFAAVGRDNEQHVQVIEMKKTNLPAGRDRDGESEN